jgi:hypothetical protein
MVIWKFQDLFEKYSRATNSDSAGGEFKTTGTECTGTFYIILLK